MLGRLCLLSCPITSNLTGVSREYRNILYRNSGPYSQPASNKLCDDHRYAEHHHAHELYVCYYYDG